MKIAYIMDPLQKIDPVWETTSALMYECNQRGHDIFFLEPHDLYVKGNKVMGRMKHVSTDPDLPIEIYWKNIILEADKEEKIYEDVKGLDVIFTRKNPPLDFRMVSFLRLVKDDVFVINDTDGQLRANNKLYMLNFPDVIPETHVSRDPQRLRKVIDDFDGDMIMKPLDSYGGHGVIKISKRDPENINSLINFYVDEQLPYSERKSVMVQEYLSIPKKGDKRILMLNGEILGAMRRIPKKGEVRANIHAAAGFTKCDLTTSDKEICNKLKKRLKEDGLYFVGIDVIGNKIIEINCISPGGIPRINKLYNIKLEQKVIDFLERKVGL